MATLLSQFLGAGWSQLEKALGPTEAAALMDRVLSPVLVEAAFQRMPALAYLPIVPNAQGTPYRFARRTAMAAALPEGSSARAPVAGNNSTYTQVNIPTKIIRSWGSFDHFVDETSDNYDVARSEVLGGAGSCAEQLCGQIFWGDVVASEYMFDGFDATQGVNVLDANAAIDTDTMDSLIDTSLDAEGTEGAQRFFFMSSHLRSGLGDDINEVVLTNYDQYPFLRAGRTLSHYRDIPIVPVSFTRPRATAGAIATAADLGYGLLADGTYHVRVAPVTRYGEQTASGASAVTITGGGGAGAIVIDLPAPFVHANINSPLGSALYWKVYVGDAADNCRLRAVFPALTYDGNGTPNGFATQVTYDGTNSARRGAVGTATAGEEDLPLLAPGGIEDEVIMLVCADAAQGCEIPVSGYKDGANLGYYDLLRLERLAKVRDAEDFFVKTYAALAVKWAATHSIARRVRRGV